jgi:transcriptional regulator NrdR family protein
VAFVLPSFPHILPGYPLAFLPALCQYVVMVCILCAGSTHVTNSRPQKRANATWRRRQCDHCGAVFTTQEGLDWSGSVVVKGSGGQEHQFIREKLLISLYDSLKHRPTAAIDAVGITDTVMNQLLLHLTPEPLQVQTIIQTSAKVLRRFDRAASVTYLAYHPTSSYR